MNIVSKYLLHVVAILSRILVCVPLAILTCTFELAARACDEVSDICDSAKLYVVRAVPMPWMIELVKASEADSDRRRKALLKQLGE